MEIDFLTVIDHGFPTPHCRAYLIHGSDDALKNQAVRLLREAVLDPSFADFDAEEHDVPPSGGGDADLARRSVAAAASAPMMSERRVVVLRGVQRLSKDDQEVLAQGLSQLGDRSCLILVAGAPEYDGGKVKARSIPSTKLTGAVSKIGCLVLCEPPRGSDLRSRAAAMAHARGKTIAPDALERILRPAASVAADRGAGARGKDIAGDLNVVTHEIEKVMSYVGDRPRIVLADVVAVGARSAEDDIFALLDAVGHRNTPQALRRLDEMLSAGDKPDAVASRTFVMLARHIRLLWGAHFLAEEHKPHSSGSTDTRGSAQHVLSGELLGLTTRQSFLLRRLQEQARSWTTAELQRALARILASDLAMKGIPPIEELGMFAPGTDPAANLRLLVIDLCAGIQSANAPGA